MKKLLSVLTATVMLLSALPSLAAQGVTREYVISCFVSAVGEDNFKVKGTDVSSFADADNISPSALSAMQTAVANGIINGYEDNTLRPEADITRLEALIILGRCLYDVPEKREATVFTDVPAWAKADIDRLYKGELVNGYGNGILGATDKISEEQVALLTQRVRSAAPVGISVKDDFYAAVNAEFLSSQSIPAGDNYISALTSLNNEVTKELIEISQKFADKKDAETSDRYDSMAKYASAFYELALSSDRSSSTDISPLLEFVNRYEGSSSLAVLGTRCGSITREICTPVLFDVYVPYKITGDKSYHTYGTICIDLLSPGIDRFYWENGQGYEAYKAYATEILTLIAEPDAAQKAEKAAALQRDIALAGKSDFQEAESVFSWGELVSKYDNFLINTIKGIDNEYIAGQNSYTISDVDRFDKAMELIKAADISTVKTVCTLNLISEFMSFLPRTYRDCYDKLSQKLMGETKKETSEEYATRITAYFYNRLYEKEFLESYAPDFDSDSLEEMVSDIISVFKKKFSNSIWLDSASSYSASNKLDKMDKNIAKPSYDEEDELKYPVPRKKTVLGNVLEYYKRNGGNRYCVYTPVNVVSPCYTVNASYNPYINSFSVYAGILSSPMYDKNASYEENLGRIGFIIAHEISHAFDKSGSNYDSSGNVNPWWSKPCHNSFKNAADRLADYYSGFEAVDGVNVDGKLTLNENIADVMAMDCIITLAKEKGLDLDKIFRAYASCQASLSSPEYALFLAKSDVHSPDKVRVNAVLSCFNEFYELYGVKEGDGMYVSPENRIRFFR